MVCPVCITTALVANAPMLASAFGGLAAAKVALDRRACVNRPSAAASGQAQPARIGTAAAPRTLVAPPRVMMYDVDEMDP